MEYAVYVKNSYTGLYETGQTFDKVSNAIAYAESMERLYSWAYCVLVKLAFTK